MATTNPYNLHHYAGLRWLAPFGLAFVLTLLAAGLMMIYPHFSG